ncbi:MAG: carboxypeptidase regulatory-like domain-containing protein, partial [Acidobacteria bacterium]|nr:carboxypeptidase regulatory-like domain-containing protein [Acidobacteriota bacterium]
YTWEIPFARGMGGVAEAILDGWAINGILSLTSGTPVSIESSDAFDNERDRTVGSESRPSLVSGRSNNPVLGDPSRWFDGSAFEIGPAGFYGNLGRLTGRGDSFTNFDFSLVKNTRLRETVSLQFRAEFFNVANHPNFSTPSGANRTAFLGSGARNRTFGRITSTANSSRQIQFGLKLVF